MMIDEWLTGGRMKMMDNENDWQPIWRYKEVGTANDYFTSEEISEYRSSQKIQWPCQLCVSRFSFCSFNMVAGLLQREGSESYHCGRVFYPDSQEIVFGSFWYDCVISRKLFYFFFFHFFPCLSSNYEPANTVDHKFCVGNHLALTS